MRVLRIVPNVPSSSDDERRAFYEGFLGLVPVMDQGWIATWAVEDDHSQQISTIDADARAPMAPSVSVGVEDVDAFHARAVTGGLEIVYGPVDEPWGVRRFFVRAPGGTVVNIVEHR